ncbi:8009_t:CDS:2, partial [Gigaspora margarita]
MDKFVIRGEEAFFLNQKRKDNAYENDQSSSRPQFKESLKKKKSKDKKHERTDWNPEWPNQFLWIDRCIVDGKPYLFCLWCKKHPTADNIFVKADHNKLEIISKMRCVYLCAQKHLPIFAYPDI